MRAIFVISVAKLDVPIEKLQKLHRCFVKQGPVYLTSVYLGKLTIFYLYGSAASSKNSPVRWSCEISAPPLFILIISTKTPPIREFSEIIFGDQFLLVK